jgi:pSer/pThr/pTyr-binding forkhead associated (FHA) protein
MTYHARLTERRSQRAGGGGLTFAECLSQRVRAADDRIVMAESRTGRVHETWWDANNQATEPSVDGPYLAAKNPWLQHQFCSRVGLGDLPFIVGRRPAAGEGLPPWQPDLELNDTAPFRLSRNHFVVEKSDGEYRVRDLCSTLGTIVNGEPIGHYLRADDSTAWGHLPSHARLRAGENEVIAGHADSPFVFSIFITSRSNKDRAYTPQVTTRRLTDHPLLPERSQFDTPINKINQVPPSRIVEPNKLDGNRQTCWNNARHYYSGLGSRIAIGPIMAKLRRTTLAAKRPFIALALSFFASGCSLAVGQDVRAYNTCLSRHPHDTVVCEGPRQAYELDPSIVQLRSVASRRAAGYGY